MNKVARASSLFKPFDIYPAGETSCKSLKLFLYNGIMQTHSNGLIHLLPLGKRSLLKLETIVRQHMNSIGGNELEFSSFGLKPTWEKTGRWTQMGKELFTLTDRNDTQYCLSPTHEESVTSLIAEKPASLPMLLYQITRKYRDEMRPRFGLLRAREFLMKDLYSFHADLDCARKTYEQVCFEYCKILKKLGLHFLKVEADTGAMGGLLSNEFHLSAPIGEDRITSCIRCGRSWNVELAQKAQCLKEDCSNADWSVGNNIEVAHAFLLGTKYSDALGAYHHLGKGEKKAMVMGCYGIGVTRLMSAAVELLSTPEEIRWPDAIAPFKICVIGAKPTASAKVNTDQMAHQLATELNEQHPGDILLDDRLELGLGRRLVEARRTGYPLIAVLGKKTTSDPRCLDVVQLTPSGKEPGRSMLISEFISFAKTHFSQ